MVAATGLSMPGAVITPTMFDQLTTASLSCPAARAPPPHKTVIASASAFFIRIPSFLRTIREMGHVMRGRRDESARPPGTQTTKPSGSGRDVTVRTRSCFCDARDDARITMGWAAMKQFHAFRLDAINHCLWRGDQRVALTPKAFDLLRYLVDHAGRVVTQDEILEALWTDTFVNQEVVKKYILGIRKVLGDRRDQPEFLRTLPSRRHQFVPPGPPHRRPPML